MNLGNNTPIEVMQGFEDIGIRFTVRDGAVKVMVPQNIELTEWEWKMLKAIKSEIINNYQRN